MLPICASPGLVNATYRPSAVPPHADGDSSPGWRYLIRCASADERKRVEHVLVGSWVGADQVAHCGDVSGLCGQSERLTAVENRRDIDERGRPVRLSQPTVNGARRPIW